MKALTAGAAAAAVLLVAPPSRGEWQPSEVQMSSSELNARVMAAGRPRLFFQESGLAKLREAVETTHREKWEKLKAAVEESLDHDPPEYRPPKIGNDPTRPDTLNDEMLWQRRFGYVLPGVALVALLDSDPKYFDHLRKWALKPTEYPLWGAGVFENADLAASHQLFGISIAYDWLYDRWSEEDRARLRAILRERGRVMYEAAEGINDRGWWKHEWRQNHAWCAYQALAATAIALAGEEPDAGVWLAKAIWGGSSIIAELPDEGAYEEGVPYWGYGMESLMRLIEAARPYASEDFYAADYFRHTPLFRLYLAGPAIWQVANFGDGPARDWHSIRPIMYRIAGQYDDPLTQWLAESLPDRRDIDATCWGLLWHDPAVPADMPSGQPLWHAFKKTGFAGARTGWGEDALTLHLRSGKAAVSHSHLDVNNFLLNAGGEWLLRDYGYGEVGEGYFSREVIYFNTSTWAHNCLVIDGKDQRKDADSIGVITHAQERDGVVWLRSDATACYEGAESVVRELALVQPHDGTGKWGYVIVRDLVHMGEAASYDFMLQPGGKAETDGDAFLITCEKARLAGKVLAPGGVDMSVVEGIGDKINVEDPLCLRVSAPAPAAQMEFLVVLVPLSAGEEPPSIEGTAGGIRVGGDELIFSPDGSAPPQMKKG